VLYGHSQYKPIEYVPSPWVPLRERRINIENETIIFSRL
jgi:hypothetical protein